MKFSWVTVTVKDYDIDDKQLVTQSAERASFRCLVLNLKYL